MASFRLCETHLLHIKPFVVNYSAISPFFGGHTWIRKRSLCAYAKEPHTHTHADVHEPCTRIHSKMKEPNIRIGSNIKENIRLRLSKYTSEVLDLSFFPLQCFDTQPHCVPHTYTRLLRSFSLTPYLCVRVACVCTGARACVRAYVRACGPI